MKTRYLIGLLAGTLLVGTTLGALIVMYVWETSMTMMLIGGDYSLELQFTDGTAASAYDWGNFLLGQTKTLILNVVNVGDVTYNMTWNTESLDLTAWSLLVYYEDTMGAQTIWAADVEGGPLEPGGSFPLHFNLTETNATAGVPYSFSLKFYSGD